MKTMSAKKRYLEEMYTRFGFLAAWLPNQRLELGMVGVLDAAGGFTPKTTLERLGIKWSASPQSSAGNLEHQYGAEIGYGAGGHGAASGGAMGTIRASASIQCNGNEGFVFRAMDCTDHSIALLDDVEEEIKELSRLKIWKKEWILVHRVHHAASTTVILTEGKGSAISIDAAGATDAGPFNLADAGLGLRAGAVTGQVTHYLAEHGLTPMYAARVVVSRLWRDIVTAPATFDGSLQPLPVAAQLAPPHLDD